jgi:hypothetical protein
MRTPPSKRTFLPLFSGRLPLCLHEAVWVATVYADLSPARPREQDLANFLQTKDYHRAVVLCLTLDQPRRLLGIFAELLDRGDHGAAPIRPRRAYGHADRRTQSGVACWGRLRSRRSCAHWSPARSVCGRPPTHPCPRS